jgi:Ca-activated chloride channel family protein
MGRIGAGALILAILCSAAAAQQPVFRVDVGLVRLLATVKNAEGQLVGTLEKGDFKVFDNGVEQDISVFERHTEQPLSVSVLVDNSASTGKEIRYELDSVARFFRALFSSGNPDDAAALYSFNDEVIMQSSFTRRHERLERALKNFKSEAGTSLYDAVYLTSKELEDRDGRRVIIVVTDGGDTTSSKTFHDALEAAQRADAVLYAVLVVPITSDAGRNVGGENALTTMSAGTGGRVFAPSVGPDLDKAFADILRDLRTQYLLGFYPRGIPPSKNRFHRLEVRVSRPGLRVQTRSGYYGVAE